MQDEIESIEKEIADFEKEQASVVASIKSLQARENPMKGVFFAEEIHSAKQEKLRLDFEIQFRKNKINRIRFGGE
ncbi:MAG: hypothetical protein ACOZEN_01440 [Thermodesulfobacteriota bacterium]